MAGWGLDQKMLLSFMVLLSAEHILLLENQKERKTKVVDGLEPRVEVKAYESGTERINSRRRWRRGFASS
jgi:hypothetical protein